LFNRHLSFAALVAISAAPAFATAVAPSTTAAKPATAGTPTAPTRAGVTNNLNANFKSMDTNGDGTLSAAELQAAESKVQQQRIAQVRARVEAEFNKLDTNHDGQLSKAEFMAAVPSAASTPANGNAILNQLDKNKDGKVTVQEYEAPILSRFDSLDLNHDGVISDAERKAAATKQPQQK
jgi:Ca2+-binding EF-hand superfamily protein